MKEYDGYKEFYNEFHKLAKPGLMPADYKETVLYVLNKTGLNPVQAEAASRYFGIGAFEDGQMEETNPLVGVGAKMGMSGAEVLQNITWLMHRCRDSARSAILEKGIALYQKACGEEAGPQAYDGYFEFYRLVNRDRNGGRLPADYRETVLYILGEAGLDRKEVKAISCYLGLGKFEDGRTEPADMKAVGMRMGISAQRVGYKISMLLANCRAEYVREVLDMGIGAYKEAYSKTYGISDAIRVFQKEYQYIDGEYRKLLEKAKELKDQRDRRAEAFAKKYGLEVGQAEMIGGKNPAVLSLPEVGLVLSGGIPKRWW